MVFFSSAAVFCCVFTVIAEPTFGSRLTINFGNLHGKPNLKSELQPDGFVSS